MSLFNLKNVEQMEKVEIQRSYLNTIIIDGNDVYILVDAFRQCNVE